MCTSIELYTGAKMPQVGLGTSMTETPNKSEIEDAVIAALDHGYRSIDCAAGYGNQKHIGIALATRIGKTLRREDVFVSSKLRNKMHAPEDVKPACQHTLNELGLDYLDMFLIHWPMALQNDGTDEACPKNPDGSIRYSDVTLSETWAAMEKLVDEGLCKHIGLSNFNTKQITEVLESCRIKPAALQIEVHPFCYSTKLINFCKERGIAVTAYSPLAAPYGLYGQGAPVNVLNDPTLKSIGEKYNKTTAHVSLRFLVQSGLAVIPKSVTPTRIAANMNIFDFELSADDMKTIEGLNRRESGRVVQCCTDVNGELKIVGLGEPSYPFIEEFWF